MKKVISVRFKENGKSYYFDPADADIRTGDYVIVETARGIECGEGVQGVKEIADAAVPKALKPTAEREILGLNEAVVAAGKLILQHTGVLLSLIHICS